VGTVEGPDVVRRQRAAALEAVPGRHARPGAAVVVPGAEPGTGHERLAEHPDVARADHHGAADLLREAPLDGPGVAVPAQRAGLGAAGREGPDVAGGGGPGRDHDLVASAGERDLGPG